MRRISTALGAFLPGNYAVQLEQIYQLAEHYRQGLEGMFLPDFVEVFGLDQPDLSIPALGQLTEAFSAEFAVRPFLQKYPERMLAQHHSWAQHPNLHLRRLASEGIRPKLPWGQDVAWLKQHPERLLPVLELLKNDPSDYVRRSVANHLNDTSKLQPQLVLQLAQNWIGQSTATDALLKHALRGLLKKGNAEALKLFNIREQADLTASIHHIAPGSLAIGEKISFEGEVRNQGTQSCLFRLEYQVNYLKANGTHSPKIFQIAERELPAGESWNFKRQHAFAELTTRKHHPGRHYLRLQLNGKLLETHEILLKAASLSPGL